MMETTWARTTPGLVCLLLAMSPVPIRGQEVGNPSTAALRLEEVIELARERNPRVRAAKLKVEATRSREPAAGLLPDPMFQVGVMNLAIPEFGASMPASMAPTFGATQRIPVAGKLSLMEEIATQSTRIDASASEEIWWNVRTEVATAFYGLYRTYRQIQVMEETLGLLQDFGTMAQAMYASGTGRQADVLRANVQVARMEADIQSLRAGRKGKVARLNALLNRPSSTDVPVPDLGALPAEVPDHATLLEWATEARPMLEGLRREVERAATRGELAGKQIWPDLTVGVQYGLGRMEGDYKGMGGASVGFSVPIYAGKRQGKLMDEAAAVEGMARARLTDLVAAVDAGLGELLAELEEAGTLLGLYREEVLPQARATVESSLSAYQAGTVDFMTLLDAQMALNRFQGEYYGLLASYGTTIARIEMTIGRELPETAELITENR